MSSLSSANSANSANSVDGANSAHVPRTSNIARSIPKLMQRFIGIFLLSSLLIVVMNIVVLVVLMGNYVPSNQASPYTIAAQAGKSLHRSARGDYVLSTDIAATLSNAGAWALLIDNSTLHVTWRTSNVPAAIPEAYALADIANLSMGYLDGYPTYTGKHADGLVVVGFPRDSFWKHTKPTWSFGFVANAPQIALGILIINVLLILGIYVIANVKLLKSVNPITRGIQRLSMGERVQIPETGALADIAAHINAASDVLQKQQVELKKRKAKKKLPAQIG